MKVKVRIGGLRAMIPPLDTLRWLAMIALAMNVAGILWVIWLYYMRYVQ
jgi:hypothetical protein